MAIIAKLASTYNHSQGRRQTTDAGNARPEACQLERSVEFPSGSSDPPLLHPIRKTVLCGWIDFSKSIAAPGNAYPDGMDRSAHASGSTAVFGASVREAGNTDF